MEFIKSDFQVLIVEDDSKYRGYLVDTVNSLGFSCIEASDGIEGLNAFETNKPNLVFSDISMPGKDGLELLSDIRKKYPAVIFVLATVFNSEEWVIKALQLGANNFLKKPIRHKNLVILLEKYYSIVKNRIVDHNISKLITYHSFLLKFKTNIEIVPKIVERLIHESEDFLNNQESLHLEMGFTEILMNAVEHGNMGITYEKKSKVLENNTLIDLYSKLLATPEIAQKEVSVEFKKDDNYCEWIITDEGEGFDWKNVPNPLDENNQTNFNGRGIFLSRFVFNELEYLGNGNKVRLRKKYKTSI